MQDEFAHHAPSLTSPLASAGAIVPDDVNELSKFTRAVFVGTAGDLSVTMLSGDDVVLSDLQPGTLYPIRVRKILATGTTAANIVGMW